MKKITKKDVVDTLALTIVMTCLAALLWTAYMKGRENPLVDYESAYNSCKESFNGLYDTYNELLELKGTGV